MRACVRRSANSGSSIAPDAMAMCLKAKMEEQAKTAHGVENGIAGIGGSAGKTIPGVDIANANRRGNMSGVIGHISAVS